MTTPDWGEARAECIRRADELIDEIHELVNETSSGPGLIAVFPRGHFRTAIRYELAAGYYGSAGLGLASLKCWKKAAELWASLDQPERAKVCEEWIADFSPACGEASDE